jgi:uncharacterized protein (DUF2141 family)
MKLIPSLRLLLYGLFILSACARQTTPTGGPKDSIPPKLEDSNPKNGQVNFKGKTVELVFSEDVILNNPREQLIITPDIGKMPDVKTKKDKVIITLDNDLNDSTTYSINFREAVQDITEKNPATNLRLAFSTGTYIDSLTIEGNIYDLLKAKESKDATVALYQSDTFNIFKHRPVYLTKTDAKGNFKLENLKPGTYYIYAIEDKNKNLIVDSKTESYGFLTKPIELVKNIAKIKIPLVRLDSRPLKLTSARPYGTYFNIKTTKSLTDFKISTNERDVTIASFGEDPTNIKLYNTFTDKDSIAIHFHATDSIDNKIDTTLYAKYTDRDTKPEAFNVAKNSFEVIASKGIVRGSINFSKPLSKINFDSIYYRIDSLKIIKISEQDIGWDSLRNVLTIQKTFDKNLLIKEKAPQSNEVKSIAVKKDQKKPSKPPLAHNSLYLGQAAFISVELDSSKRISEESLPLKLENTGVITVQIAIKSDHFLVQLLTKDYQVITQQQNKRKISFEDLKPGDYQLRLIIDANNDGTWNTGNFFKREEPEDIKFYKNEKVNSIINLKANWELGPLLISEQ